MLAERKCPETQSLAYPIYASPKLDGIRCLVVDGQARSRALKPFPNSFVQARFSRAKYSGLDGELVLGDPTAPDVYRATQKALSNREGEPDVKFYCFDIWDSRLPFCQRHARLQDLIPEGGLRNLFIVPQHFISDEAELLRYERDTLDLGYEGLILRSPDGPYKYGRSTLKEGWMLKLKRFSDSEARILEVLPEMHNGNEATTDNLGRTKRSSHKANKTPKARVGKFVVEDPKLFPGVTFEVPCAAIPHRDRELYWQHRAELIGKWIKYKFFDHGGKDRPRHPVWLGPREEWDL